MKTISNNPKTQTISSQKILSEQDNQANWKKISEVANLLRGYGHFYSFQPRDEMLKAFAQKLIDYNISDIRAAMDEMTEAADNRFPTLANIKSCVHALKASREQIVPSGDDPEYIKEQHRFKKEYDKILKVIGMDNLKKYYALYLKDMFGKEESEYLDSTGLDKKAFIKCAIFDLAESGTGGVRGALEVRRRKEANLMRKASV